jgi:hypothetical protein
MITHVGGIPLSREPDELITTATRKRVAAGLEVQRLQWELAQAPAGKRAAIQEKLNVAREKERAAQAHLNALRARQTTASQGGGNNAA